jgi:Fe-S-cluster containining protein
MLSAEVVDYYLMRGDKFYVQDNGAMMFYVKSPCQHLGPDGCTIYETRPPTCVNYMCPQGDKSVKDAFAHQIAVTLERVKIANKAWRDEQAKLKQVQEVKEAI